jgi:uncharacterized membrane protein HdeD (DUF308 family)
MDIETEEAITNEVPEIKLWFVILLRGIAALLFGIVAVSNPGMPIARLATIFAFYVLVDGIATVYAAVQAFRADERGRLFAAEAIMNGVSAVILFALPGAISLRVIGGIRGAFVGAFEADWSLRRKPDERRWTIAAGGLAVVAFGFLLLGWPEPGERILPWFLGLGALVSGMFWTGGAMAHVRDVLRAAYPRVHPSPVLREAHP